MAQTRLHILVNCVLQAGPPRHPGQADTCQACSITMLMRIYQRSQPHTWLNPSEADWHTRVTPSNAKVDALCIFAGKWDWVVWHLIDFIHQLLIVGGGGSSSGDHILLEGPDKSIEGTAPLDEHAVASCPS